MTDNIPFLHLVIQNDQNCLKKARLNYGESWCKRGGVGAFMMLARKWDRLEQFLGNKDAACPQWDILRAIEIDGRAEGIIDDIRDLRRYLALVEAKAMELGYCPDEVKKDVGDVQSKLKSTPAVYTPQPEDQPTATSLHPA